MTKQEFLQGLSACLEGEVPLSVIQDNLRYYDGYIDSQVQSGKPERDVLAELGDPRWIAKTIIDATPGGGEGSHETKTTSYQQEFRETGQEPKIHYFDFNKWYVKLIAILVVILLIFLFLFIISGVMSLVIGFLPVIAMVAVVMWIVRGFRR